MPASRSPGSEYIVKLLNLFQSEGEKWHFSAVLIFMSVILTKLKDLYFLKLEYSEV